VQQLVRTEISKNGGKNAGGRVNQQERLFCTVTNRRLVMPRAR
jgi:hypothetical protein